MMDDCSVFSSSDHVRGDGDGERFCLPTAIKDFDDSKKDFFKNQIDTKKMGVKRRDNI